MQADLPSEREEDTGAQMCYRKTSGSVHGTAARCGCFGQDGEKELFSAVVRASAHLGMMEYTALGDACDLT